MTRESIIIVGAGVAGMSVGCYGQMNGLRTRIFESGRRAGGLCTGWTRGDYTIDGCIRWLTGTVPRNRYHQVWQELGVVPRCEMIRYPEFLRVQGADGTSLVVHNDIDRLTAHLMDLAPADAALIEELTDGIRRFSETTLPLPGPRELDGQSRWTPEVARLLPLARLLRHRSDDGSLQGFAARFQSPFLREALPAVFDVHGFSVVCAMLVLAARHHGDGAVPVGGSQALARAVEERYLALGGEVTFDAAVAEVLIEGNRACGVRLTDGSEHRADIVVSAADGQRTLFHMLGGRYLTHELRRWYKRLAIFPPLVQVSFGVDRDLRSEPHEIRYLLEQPMQAAGEPVPRLTVRHYGSDETLAPAGKTVVQVSFPSVHERWQELAGDGKRYSTEKRAVAETVAEWLEERWPGFGDQLELVDVATPLTYERYTGNWQGSPEGWALTHDVMVMLLQGGVAPRTLPGLKNFFMAGHWIEPGGGLPTVATSGREVVQVICHRLKRKFVTTLP